MSVYFVYRSHYEGPSGKHVRKLDAESVLGWFQSVWERAKRAEDISEWAKAELGCDVYGFSSLFEAARDESLAPPRSDRELKSYLTEHLYVEGEILYKPHVLQVITNDDEIEMAYFFIDDHYLKEHPGRAAYLLHEDWKLPTTIGANPYTSKTTTKQIKPSTTGSGMTHLVFLACYDSGNLTDLGLHRPCRIEGLRIPQLYEYLRTAAPNESWPLELRLLRAQLSPDDPAEDRLRVVLERVAHLHVVALAENDWPSRMGLGTIEQARAEIEEILKTPDKRSLDHDPSKSLISRSEHIVQLCLHTGWTDRMYHQWFIFDDLWAGEHRDLAEGILRYARRWDVLTGS